MSESEQLIKALQARQVELDQEIDALKKKDDFLQAVINNAGEPIFVKDSHSRIILANDGFCQMFGMDRDDLFGKTLADNVPEAEREHFLKVDRQVLADGIKNSCEETLTFNGHAQKTLITTKTRYTDADGHHFLIGVINDITERKQLEQQLKLKATTDYLTGINNRGHFLELAELEFSRTTRYDNALSLLMLDIDFFKKINDQYGHAAGDWVLKQLTEICKNKLREIDILGRFGGEEFAILLPETDYENAITVAEYLRKSIEDFDFTISDNNVSLHITVSIGVSAVNSHIKHFDALLVMADQALYRAKNAGRNQVR